MNKYAEEALAEIRDTKDKAMQLSVKEIFDILGIKKITKHLKDFKGIEIVINYHNRYFFEAKKGRNCNFCIFFDSEYEDTNCYFEKIERKPYKRELKSLKHADTLAKNNYLKYKKFYKCASDMCIPIYAKNNSDKKILFGVQCMKYLKKDLINHYCNDFTKYFKSKEENKQK